MATIGQKRAARLARKASGLGSGRLYSENFRKQADGSYVNTGGGNVLGASDYNPQGTVGGLSNPNGKLGELFDNPNDPEVQRTVQKYYQGGGAGGDPNAGNKPVVETPSFLRSGVSNIGSTGPSVGSQTAGGQRGVGIAGTGIRDSVYENLIKQYEKDSQLNLNLDKIKSKTRSDAQAEIDAVNAIYRDMIGRAEKTGQENLGSERAIQARSGTLPSSFGQGAIQKQKENTNKNIAEIEAQRANALSTVYQNSRNQALQEYDRLSQLRSTGIDGYMQAMEKERGMLDEGLANVAQNLAYQGFDGNDLGEEGLAKIAQDWKVSPEVVFNKIMEKRGELDNAVMERSIAMQKAGLGSDGTPIADESNFDSFSQESVAMSVLPTQLRNSDAEREYYQKGIRQGLEQGMDPYEIADVLMGYNVQNKDEFSDSIRQMIGYSDLPPNKVADIARNINAGKPVVALNIIEKNLYDQARKLTESDYIAESNVTNAIQRVDELTEKINNLKKSPIGVTKGTIAEFMGRVRGKEASKIKTDVTVLVEQMRKELLGSAVTPSEERFLEARLPKISDQPDVFMYKLEALKSEPLRRLNSIRTQFNMVPLDRESLFDKNLRVEDYYSMGASMPQQQQYSTAGGGDSNWNW